MRWPSFRISPARRRQAPGPGILASLECNSLERRLLLSAAGRHAVAAVSSTVASGADIAPGVHGYDPTNPTDPSAPPSPDQVLTTQDVQTLLERAAAATNVNGAIIAVVDRNGTILGVRVESGVSPQITDNTTNLVFAIDGAVALARTGAYFANDTAPLTSRTIQDISQTTITQREVQSNPDVPDPGGNSTVYGPGYVAPVGIKGHFPPGYQFQPQVDLFDIEGTNRDTISNITGTRFNVPAQYIPPGGNLVAPESYGQVTGILPTAQSRGIATLPGGVPLYKKQPDGTYAEVGGIGVFFPGTTGYATEENSTLNTPALRDKHKPDYSDIAEYMAFVAAGGSKQAGVPFNGPINGAPALPNFTLPFGRIDLVGITLNIYGNGGLQGINHMLSVGRQYPFGSPTDGTDMPVDAVGDKYLPGQGVPYGWLVTPHAGGDLTAADVEAIVARGIASATQTRAQIRLPLNSTTRMVFAVSDESGDILGLYRMPDATYFSLGVAVAKARNVAYYDNAGQLQPADKIKGIPAGTALTARTFRYISLPHFPEGIDINPPGPGSILTDGGVTKYGTNKGAPLPAKAFQSLQGYADFNPNTNFRAPTDKANQNGVVFFPGSAPLYKDETDSSGATSRQIVGGLGVSGDGVFQDDDVTAVAALAYAPPSRKRADFVKLRDVRLPFLKFNRNPHVPIGGPTYPEQSPLPLPLPPSRKKTG
jgi:uncharacterized protein GlcG (DUF336 family)